MKPFLALLMLAAMLVPALPGQAADQLDFSAWGMLAIQDAGRRKPIDTFARETLMRLTGRSSVEAAGRRWEQNDFLLSMLLGTHEWEKEPLILVGYRPLVEHLKLDASKKRFSFEQLSKTPALVALATEAAEARKTNKELTRMQKEVESVAGRMQLFHSVADGRFFLIAPPAAGGGDKWLSPTEMMNAHPAEPAGKAFGHLQELAKAYSAHDAFNFSLHANQLRASLAALNPAVYPSDAALRTEFFYNNLDPFQWAEWFYGLGFVALWIAHVNRTKRWALWTGLGAALTGLLFHAGGIALRSVIAGRPPVTNMYESVVWVSFGVMAFGIVFYSRYKAVVYLLAALPASFLCLVLLRQLPVAMSPSIDPLVPVLRSNFWLTVHVLTITLSYAAFLLAMAFGHIVLWRFIREPQRAASQVTLHFWLYRVIQLGVLLLAAGTILGGVWANYSWGRFWGWDPKETWALIALLCYLLVLHGRIAGWWDKFGLAVASIICFCAVLMTWYGVNFILGKGLHSYGFGIGGEGYVALFVALEITYVAVAAFRYLRARAAMQPVPAPVDEEVETVDA